MRAEVLQCYRRLYRTCQQVFRGDRVTFQAAKKKLKEEFLKNSGVEDETTLSKLVLEGNEAERFLKESVVQAVQTSENTFRVRFTKDNVLEDNLKPPKHNK